MQPLKLLEYLYYLAVFILLFKTCEPAHINSYEETTTSNPSDTEKFSKRDTLKRAFGDCEKDYSWMCLKIQLVKFMERVTEQEVLHLMPGVTLVRNENATTLRATDMMAEVARSYPNDPNLRLNGYIVSKVSNFLQSHHLRLKLIDQHTISEARAAVQTGRKGGKFGKKGGLEALVAAGLMMKGTLMAVGMGAIALMAGKALMTALMALTLSAVLGLKSLASGGGKSTTYEIVAKPIYTASHSHSVSHDEGHGGGHYSSGVHSGSGGGFSGYARSLKLDVPNTSKTVKL